MKFDCSVSHKKKPVSLKGSTELFKVLRKPKRGTEELKWDIGSIH